MQAPDCRICQEGPTEPGFSLETEQVKLRAALGAYIDADRRAELNAYGCLTMSTEISTAGVVPLFSSQWTVLRSSGQPSPGP